MEKKGTPPKRVNSEKRYGGKSTRNVKSLPNFAQRDDGVGMITGLKNREFKNPSMINGFWKDIVSTGSRVKKGNRLRVSELIRKKHRRAS